jgi:hypothetical protein
VGPVKALFDTNILIDHYPDRRVQRCGNPEAVVEPMLAHVALEGDTSATAAPGRSVGLQVDMMYDVAA